MSFTGLLSVVGSILLSIGGGTVVVFALSKWLGGVWAARILLQEEVRHQREFEALVRRRNIYSKLATALRVHIRSDTAAGDDLRARFLEAYDEASVWAPDTVMNPVGFLLDLVKNNTDSPASVPQSQLRNAYIQCITAMRKDAGFDKTTFEYRVVTFQAEGR